MRVHFISRLSLLLASSFLVVVSQVWSGSTLKWLFFAGGIVALVIAAADSVRDSIPQRTIDLMTAVIGAWMVVEVLALNAVDYKWWSFGSAVAIAGLSAIGLTIHEMTTERVVHELSVTGTTTTERDEVPVSSLS